MNLNIEIMSYNIHSAIGNDGKLDYCRIGEYLSNVKADIVCLQEFDLRNPELDQEHVIDCLKAGHFKYFIATPAIQSGTGYFGNAMLSKFKPQAVKELRIGYKNNEPRNIQHVIFDVNDTKFSVLNTHFGLQLKERNRQFKQLQGLVNKITKDEKQPLIVVGDFNEWLPITTRLKQMNALLNPAKLGVTFPSRFPLFKLDKAWTNAHMSIKSAKVLKNRATKIYSDHYPILINSQL